MESLQTMRWILVSMSAVAAIIAISLGYVLAGIILLLGVALHTGHWYLHRGQPAATPASDS